MQNMYVTPCRQICRLDKHDLCVGCGRTKKEISEWSKYHYYQRMKIMKRLGYGQRQRTRRRTEGSV